MADDSAFPSFPSFSPMPNMAAPGGNVLPQGGLKDIYAALLNKNRQQQSRMPILSWTQVAGGIADTLADQIQASRLAGAMGGGQQDAISALGLGSGQQVDSGPAPSSAPQTASDVHDGDLIGFIKNREGFSATPYADGKQTSIGYGTRAQPGDTSIDQAEGDRRLNQEVGKAAGAVQAFAPEAPNPVKHALTDLTYNAGSKWMSSGLGNAVQQGDWGTAKGLFTQYSHADGQFNQGLYNRRLAMAPMFDLAGQGGQQVAQAGSPQQTGAGTSNLPAQAPPSSPHPAARVEGAGVPAGRPGQYIDPKYLPPTMTSQQMESARRALANPFLPEAQRNQIIQRMQQGQTPYEREVPGGKVVIDPRSGSQQFYDLSGAKVKEAGGVAAAQEQAKLSAAESTSAHTTLTGIRGLGVTGSNIEPYTAAALKIVNDPSFKQTGLVSADNQLMFERLKKQFNMADNATPLAVLGQIRNTVLNGMQSGAKSFSTEGGEAARLFQSEIGTMQGELPPASGTREEQIAGWNAVHRRAVKWGDDALYFNDWAKKQPNGLPTSDIHSQIIQRNRAFKPYDESVGTPAAQQPFNQRFGTWNTGPGALGTAQDPTSGLQPGQAIPASSFTERSRNITRKANENAGPGAALVGMAGGAPLLTGGVAAAARAGGMTLPKILEILMHGAATTGAIGAANKLFPSH